MDDDNHPVSSCDPMLSSPAPSSTLSSSSPTSIYSNDDALSSESIDLLVWQSTRAEGATTPLSPHNLFKRQISENVQRMLNSSSADLRMLNSSGADLFLLSAENGLARGESRDLARQESRDSLIEVALDNTEQIVSKLLGKNSRSILNGRNQSPLLELWSALLEIQIPPWNCEQLYWRYKHLFGTVIRPPGGTNNSLELWLALLEVQTPPWNCDKLSWRYKHSLELWSELLEVRTLFGTVISPPGGTDTSLELWSALLEVQTTPWNCDQPSLRCTHLSGNVNSPPRGPWGSDTAILVCRYMQRNSVLCTNVQIHLCEVSNYNNKQTKPWFQCTHVYVYKHVEM